MPPDIKVIKLKIRRGTDADRKLIKLDQGELGFTTDTQRVFVGNGVDSGGVVVGNKVYAPANNTYNHLSTINAQVGDIQPLSGVSYQLIGTDYTQLSNWSLFSPRLNTTYLKYSNDQTGVLTLTPASIDSSVLSTTTLSSTTINFNSSRINVNYDASIFGATTQLTILTGGINASHISPSTLGKGLTGGNGTPISVDVDGTTISFAGNKLQLISSPVTALRVENLTRGFNTYYTTTGVDVRTVITGVSGTSLGIGGEGILYLNSPPLTAFGSFELPYVTAEDGYITQIASSIYDILSVDSAVPRMSAYNGVVNQLFAGWTGDNNQTTINAISAGGPITLSSAGFVVFRGQQKIRRDGSIYTNSFAIPVFSLPFDIP
jgi:hypothetical protein